MDLLNNLALGFSTAFSLTNLLYCFIGVTLGTLIGVLPGLGPVATLAMLLPITYSLDPTAALIMLAGIYYGSQYGGSTTAILVNLPGESASVVTCLDGYQMARKGKAGTALGLAAIGSFIAGCFATVLVAAFAPPLIELAFKFGPAEYFSLMVLGLVGAVVLANGSILKAFAMIILGLLLGIIGADVNSGAFRFDFGISELQDGIDFVAISMGLFGFTEIMVNLQKGEARESLTEKVGSIWPSKKEFLKAIPSISRGTLLGSFLGILPGGGALLASFASYSLEKKLGGTNAKPPFGEGNLNGVAGPESANNAGAQTSFIPMLTLGIPSNATMALMIGALMIHNITPGPQVMSTNPTLFWGLVASMWIGNLMLVILNLPLIGIWVQLLRVPYSWLYPAILTFCCIGVYSINNNPFDVYITILCGALGYLFYKLRCEPAPLILGFILGHDGRKSQKSSLVISRRPLHFLNTSYFIGPVNDGFIPASAGALACH